MKKIYTLKKNYEFKNVLSRGRFIKGKYLIIYCKKNNKNINRIGIAINTHIAKAVRRNRIKRLIRENYRLIKNDLFCGYDIIFLWNKNMDINDATFGNIKYDMLIIFKKIGIMKWKK